MFVCAYLCACVCVDVVAMAMFTVYSTRTITQLFSINLYNHLLPTAGYTGYTVCVPSDLSYLKYGLFAVAVFCPAICKTWALVMHHNIYPGLPNNMPSIPNCLSRTKFIYSGYQSSNFSVCIGVLKCA